MVGGGKYARTLCLLQYVPPTPLPPTSNIWLIKAEFGHWAVDETPLWSYVLNKNDWSLLIWQWQRNVMIPTFVGVVYVQRSVNMPLTYCCNCHKIWVKLKTTTTTALVSQWSLLTFTAQLGTRTWKYGVLSWVASRCGHLLRGYFVRGHFVQRH